MAIHGCGGRESLFLGDMLPMPQPHTHAHMGSINWTQEVIINNKKEDTMLSGRQGGGVGVAGGN